MSKVIKPESEIIEQTALELAATFYEICRGQGLTSKYKNARLYAKANFEKFIPKALDTLTAMLGNLSTPENQKELIYKAILERANDPSLNSIFPKKFPEHLKVKQNG